MDHIKSKHIFLTGFMGSGKTTIGKKLASLMRVAFTDLDHYIEQRENKTISFIFEYESEDHFRMIETSCLNEIIGKDGSMVTALGGGTVCFGNNIEPIKNNGLLIYIKLTAADLAGRLGKSQQNRPLLKKIEKADLETTIAQKLEQRQSYYEQAHLTVSGLNLTAQTLHQQILEFEKEHNIH